MLAAIWFMIQHKEKIPDEIEPVTVAEQEARLAPIEHSTDNSDYQWAVRNIAFGLKALDEQSHSAETIHEALCGNAHKRIEGGFPSYERITGAKHHRQEEYPCD